MSVGSDTSRNEYVVDSKNSVNFKTGLFGDTAKYFEDLHVLANEKIKTQKFEPGTGSHKIKRSGQEKLWYSYHQCQAIVSSSLYQCECGTGFTPEYNQK